MDFPFEGIPTVPPRKDMSHMVCDLRADTYTVTLTNTYPHPHPHAHTCTRKYTICMLSAEAQRRLLYPCVPGLSESKCAHGRGDGTGVPSVARPRVRITSVRGLCSNSVYIYVSACVCVCVCVCVCAGLLLFGVSLPSDGLP